MGLMVNTTGRAVRPISAAHIERWHKAATGQSAELRESASREIRAELRVRGLGVFSDANYGLASTGDSIGEERSLKVDGSLTTLRTLNLGSMTWSREVELTTDQGTSYVHEDDPRLRALGFETDRGEPDGVPRVSTVTTPGE